MLVMPDAVNNGQFSPQNAADFAKLSHTSPNRKPRNYRKTSRTQALDLQNALHKAGQLLKTSIEQCKEDDSRARVASALASVAKGWQSMTEMLRVMSGKPNPGTLSPSERANARSKHKPSHRPVPRPAVSPSVEESSKESLS